MRTWVRPEGTEGYREPAEVEMWYEIIPSFVLTYVFLVIPGMSTTLFQKLANGGKPKRIVRDRFSWSLMERDKIVSKNNCHYNAKGLENID